MRCYTKVTSVGVPDIIISYIANPEVRPWIRRVLSRLFVTLINWKFGFDVRYYNGVSVHRTELIREALGVDEEFRKGVEATVVRVSG